MFGVPCGCQTTLSPTNLIICSCPSWTRASPKESAIEVWHPQLIHKKTWPKPYHLQKNPSGVRFSCPEPRKWRSHSPCLGWRTWFYLGEGGPKEHSLAPQGFSTPSHLSWILNLTELCFQSGVFQAKNGKRQISLDTNRHRHSKPKGNRWILSRISLALIVKWSIPWHEKFRPFCWIFTDICP